MTDNDNERLHEYKQGRAEALQLAVALLHLRARRAELLHQFDVAQELNSAIDELKQVQRKESSR